MSTKIETVVPTPMMALEELDGDDLLIRVAQVGKRCVINLADNSRYLSKFCDKLEKDDLWKKIAPTWDEFCQKAFGHPGDYVNLIRTGVALLDKGDEAPIPVEEAKKAAMAEMVKGVPPIEGHGGARPGAGRPAELAELAKPPKKAPALHRNQVRLPNLNRQSETSEYLVARIKRDRPDIAERMVKGEFKSVNQAAREAGIQVRPSVKLGGPETVAQSISRLKGEEYVAALIVALEKIINRENPRRPLDE